LQESPVEVEVKFHILHLADIARRLEDLGAALHCERVLEHNLRFDTGDRRLERDHQALRLRQDSATTLTFKGPSGFQDGIRLRTEIETRVEDFSRARLMLEALGYVVTFEYEKFRTTYVLAGTSIMLDELPYGHFVEIEGEPKAIKAVAGQLGLRWEAAIRDSYMGLFEQLKARHNLLLRGFTFDEFADLAAHVRDLGIQPADA
jgi:adenylate cyclase class 2